MDTAEKINAYIDKQPQWEKELKLLLKVIRKSKMEEAIKWGMPTFLADGKMILGLGAFKKHFCLWYFNGALLKDEAKVLINAQTGKTQGMRQWRFEKLEDINVKLIHQYTQEAIVNLQAGKVIKVNRVKVVPMPAEMKNYLSQHKKIAGAFEKLSRGKQNEYNEHIAEAKRATTKEKRLEKCAPMILAGVGLHDKYKK